MEKEFISYDRLLELIFRSAKKLGSEVENKMLKIDYIVAIGTGGFVIAKCLYEIFRSKKLKKKFNLNSTPKLLTLIVERYEGEKGKSLKLISGIQNDLRGKVILVVDDVSDEGVTFKKVIEILEMKKPEKIITLSLHIKPKTSFIPDVWVEKTDKWIVYPYEKEFFEEIDFP